MIWYDKYTNIPFKHLGNDLAEGIDCFNLIVEIARRELNIELPMRSSDFCSADTNWYNHFENPFEAFKKYPQIITKIDKESTLKVYDIILLSIGACNVINHSALYVDRNKILNIVENSKSRISTYGNYYKNYTIEVWRWNKFLKI